MGYRMEYGGNVTKTSGGQVVNKKRTWVLAVVFVLVLTVCYCFRKSEFLQKTLLPGDPEVTANAANCFSENLKQGMDVSDAISAFIEDIMANEK